MPTSTKLRWRSCSTEPAQAPARRLWSSRRPGPVVAPDRLALGRLNAEAKRVWALSLVERHDDAAVARLAAIRVDKAAIMATPVAEDQPSAAEALDSLANLGRLWRETSDVDRRALTQTTLARLGAVGGRIVSVEVTPAAERHGLALALPEMLVAMVGDTGLEPVTSCMSSKCSNQLS